jgi:hypothetical protein
MDDVELYTDINRRAVSLLAEVQEHIVLPWHLVVHSKLNQFNIRATELRGELAELDCSALMNYRLPLNTSDAGLKAKQITIVTAVRNTAVQTLGEVSGSLTSHRNSINFARSFLVSIVALYFAIA